MKSWFRLAPLAGLALAACSLDGILGSSKSCVGTAYSVGSSVSATMGSNNCQGPTGKEGHLFTLTVTEQTNIKVTVTTSAFEPTISVFTSNDKFVGETSVNGLLQAFLPADSYKILISSPTGDGGAYTLTTPTTTLGGGCLSANGSLVDADMGYTLKGAEFSGQVVATDCGAVNAKMHWYRVRLAGTDTLNTTVTVDKPAGLYLENTAGTVIATKELPAAGTWTNTYAATADGAFTLRIESRASGSVSNLPLHYTVALK